MEDEDVSVGLSMDELCMQHKIGKSCKLSKCLKAARCECLEDGGDRGKAVVRSRYGNYYQ